MHGLENRKHRCGSICASVREEATLGDQGEIEFNCLLCTMFKDRALSKSHVLLVFNVVNFQRIHKKYLN